MSFFLAQVRLGTRCVFFFLHDVGFNLSKKLGDTDHSIRDGRVGLLWPAGLKILRRASDLLKISQIILSYTLLRTVWNLGPDWRTDVCAANT